MSGVVLHRYIKISIHAPRAGGDAARKCTPTGKTGFQSTPPVRGATIERLNERMEAAISIHAPRAGGD